MRHYNLASLTVVVIDDDSLMREIFRTLLNGLGVGRVELTATISRGYETIIAVRPDLVLLDVELGDRNGLDFLKEIRSGKLGLDRMLPILVVTGNANVETVLAARDAGATDILTKPLTGLRLYGRIVSMIENPRPFISTEDFFGPDRRRRARSFDGPDRRQNYEDEML